MISISHSPNSTIAQAAKSLAWIFFPWRWFNCKKGKRVGELERKFKQEYGAEDAFTFSQGREAFYALLKAVGIGKGDEVLLQAYTCIVVPNAILWAGAKPVYIDVDETFNINPALIEKKITPSTKAIIVQHAFGVPVDIKKIKEICKKHNLILIEDCALSLGAKFDGKKVGTFGDVAFFSFGRDKVISSVSGGLAIVYNPEIAEKMKGLVKNQPSRSWLWISQNLVHTIKVPIATRLMGRLKIGQGILLIMQKIGLLNRVYQDCEKITEAPKKLMHQMPNAMADLALQQLNQLERFNSHRKNLAALYKRFCDPKSIIYQKVVPGSEPIFLRFAILIDNPEKLLKLAKSKGFLLGDWYKSVVVPEPPDLAKINYKPGEAPQAEIYAKKSLNLPTHHKMNEKATGRLLGLLDDYFKS